MENPPFYTHKPLILYGYRAHRQMDTQKCLKSMMYLNKDTVLVAIEIFSLLYAAWLLGRICNPDDPDFGQIKGSLEYWMLWILIASYLISFPVDIYYHILQ